MDNHLYYMKDSRVKQQKRRDKRMGEELIECGRLGKKWPGPVKKGYKKAIQSTDPAYLPKRESIRTRSGNCICQDDNLAPMIRFLVRNRNRPWNKVYAELNKKASFKGMIGNHLKDHLWDMVERHVDLVDGRPVYKNYHWLNHRKGCIPGEIVSYGFRWPQFYIHPENGLLKMARDVNGNKPFHGKKRKARKKKKKKSAKKR